MSATNEQRAEILRRLAAGESTRGIAAALKHSRNFVARVRDEGLIKLPAALDVDKFKELWADGVSKPLIAQHFGNISKSTVDLWRTMLKLPKRAPGAKFAASWSADDIAIIIKHGYSLRADQLAELCHGKNHQACERMRRQLAVDGKIARPVVAPKPVKARKPPTVAAPKHKRQKAEERRAPHAKPSRPERQPLPPLTPEPTYELQPHEERLIRLPWAEIKRFAASHGVIMTQMHDHQRLLKRLAELGKDPVFIDMRQLPVTWGQ